MSDRDEAIRRADRLAARGEFDAAIAEYQRVLEAFPTDLPTMNALGDLLVRAGASDRAVPLFRQIADVYLAEGFYARAAGYFKKLLKFAPGDERATVALAEACASQGLRVEAQRHLESVVAAYRRREDTAGLARLRETARRLEQLAQAAQQARTFGADLENAAASPATAPHNENDSAPAPATVAVPTRSLPHVVAFEIDLTGEVEALAAESANREPAAPEGTVDASITVSAPPTEAMSGETAPPADLVAQGRSRLSAGHEDEAIALFLAATRASQSRYDASVALSDVYVQRGQADAAIEWLERAAEAADTPARRGATLYRLGVLLERAGEPARSLAVLLEVNVLAPGFRDVTARIARLSTTQSGGGSSGL